MKKNLWLSLFIPVLTSFQITAIQPVSVKAQNSGYDSFANSQIIAQQTAKSFQEYLQSGYKDLKSQNYQQALFNFNSALNLRPDDKEAQQAVIRTKGYIYDFNMEKGYEATNNREYERALTYFRFAAEQRPDDFYSQQAIQNVEKQQQKVESGEDNFSGQNRLVTLLIFIFALLFIIIMALISIGWRMVQLNNSKNNNYKKYRQKSDTERETDSISPPPQQSILTPPTPQPQQTQSQLNQPPQNQREVQQKPQSQIVSPAINNQTPVVSSNPNTPSYLATQTQNQGEMIVAKDETQKLLADLQQANRVERNKIVWNLATQADSRAIQPLVNLMMSSNSQEKSLILEALSQIGFNSIKPINHALMIALQDQHGQVRKNALRDITKLYELMIQIRPIIAHATLNDPDNEVREIARWALGKIQQNHILTGQPQQQGYDQEINATIIDDNNY